MKAWIWTYVLFLRHLLHISVRIVGFVSALLILARGLVPPSVPQAMLFGFATAITEALFLFCVIRFFSVAGWNLGWLQIIPMSKRQLILLFCAIQITAIFFSMATSLAIELVGAIGLAGVTLSQVGQCLHELWNGQWSLLRERPSLSTVAFTLTLLNVVLFFLFKAPFGRFPTGSRTYRPDTRFGSGAFFFLWPFAVVFSLIFLNQYLTCPLGGNILLSLAFMYLLPVSWSRGLSLGRSMTRKANILCLGLVAVEALSYYGVAIYQRKSSDVTTRAQSLIFLGPFATNVTSREIAKILQEADPGSNEVRDLGHRYITLFGNGALIDARKGGIEFPNAIASKRTLASFKETYDLFDSRTFQLFEVAIVAHALEANQYDWNDRLPLYQLIDARLSPRDTVTLLSSRDEAENFFALARGRYDRQEVYIKAIADHISHYTDRAALYALGTLSLLCGRHITFNDLQKLGEIRRQLALYQPDCSGFQPDSTASDSDRARRNVCLRATANHLNAAALNRLESQPIYW